MRIRAHSLLILPLAFALAVIAAGRAEAACPPKQGAIYDVKIDSSPAGAQIYLGEKSCGLVGTTPWVGKLPAGDFTVILESTGYDQAMRTLKVAKIRKQQELFIPMTRRPQIEGRNSFNGYIREAMANVRPIRDIVVETITASGNNYYNENGPANFPVLASATPSLESFVNAQAGRYHHVKLASRHGVAEMPEVKLIDLRHERDPVDAEQKAQWLSPPLRAALEKALAAGEQAIELPASQRELVTFQRVWPVDLAGERFKLRTVEPLRREHLRHHFRFPLRNRPATKTRTSASRPSYRHGPHCVYSPAVRPVTRSSVSPEL